MLANLTGTEHGRMRESKSFCASVVIIIIIIIITMAIIDIIIMIKIAQPDQHKQTDKHIHIYIVNIVYIVICNILYLTMYTCISYDQQSTTWHEICHY